MEVYDDIFGPVSHNDKEAAFLLLSARISMIPGLLRVLVPTWTLLRMRAGIRESLDEFQLHGNYLVDIGGIIHRFSRHTIHSPPMILFCHRSAVMDNIRDHHVDIVVIKSPQPELTIRSNQ